MALMVSIAVRRENIGEAAAQIEVEKEVSAYGINQ